MNMTGHPACHYLLPMLLHPVHKDIMRDFSLIPCWDLLHSSGLSVCKCWSWLMLRITLWGLGPFSVELNTIRTCQCISHGTAWPKSKTQVTLPIRPFTEFTDTHSDPLTHGGSFEAEMATARWPENSWMWQNNDSERVAVTMRGAHEAPGSRVKKHRLLRGRGCGQVSVTLGPTWLSKSSARWMCMHWWWRNQLPLPTKLQAPPTTKGGSPKTPQPSSRAVRDLDPGQGQGPCRLATRSTGRSGPGQRWWSVSHTCTPVSGGGHSGTQASSSWCSPATALGQPAWVWWGGRGWQGQHSGAGRGDHIPSWWGDPTRELRPLLPLLHCPVALHWWNTNSMTEGLRITRLQPQSISPQAQGLQSSRLCVSAQVTRPFSQPQKGFFLSL